MIVPACRVYTDPRAARRLRRARRPSVAAPRASERAAILFLPIACRYAPLHDYNHLAAPNPSLMEPVDSNIRRPSVETFAFANERRFRRLNRGARQVPPARPAPEARQMPSVSA